jgi:hypothetical protein
MGVDYFVSGTTPPPPGLLGGLLPAWPEGVAKEFVEAYTHPDAIVLHPFAVSDVPIRETMALGRRVVSISSNPLIVLLLRQRLSPPAPAELKTALTRLGDSHKRGIPLRQHLNQLYRTHCPTCDRWAVADYFIWSREPADPRQKWVDCPGCGQAGLAAVDETDLTILDEVETRGLHYWYLLDRVASPAKSSPGDKARAHTERLLELYTTRALYAVADLLMRIEATFDQEIQTHLKAVLLTCLGQASSLHPPDTARGRDDVYGSPTGRSTPHKLGLPSQFIERNVWHLFETAVNEQADYAAAEASLPLQADLHWVDKVPASPQGLAWLHNLGVSAVGRNLTPESVSLVLSIPPEPNPVFWSLAYLWAGWLFGPDEAGKLKSLALQKWPDWAWYQSVMTTALRALRPVLRFDGVCVLTMNTPFPQQVSATVLAALAAGYDVESWQHRATGEHQCTLVPAPLHAPTALEPDSLRPRVAAESAKAALDFVRARGEPVQTETLHIAAWHRLMRKGLLEVAQASLPSSRVLSWLKAAINEALETTEQSDLNPVLDEGKGPVGWWPPKVGRGMAKPLSDRVEEAVLDMLHEAEAKNGASVEEVACRQSIYRRFNGPLTPDAGLVHACLAAYGDETAPGHWRLGQGEREVTWQEDMSAITRDLLTLGERLGYQARQWGRDFNVVWEEEGHAWAIFNLIATANVARFLPAPDSAPDQEAPRWRNLVIPTARTGLWQHKLATQPWLAHMIEAGGWTFIKVEHLQVLAGQEEVTRHDLKAVVGLVPPLESGEGQLPLF